MAARSVPGAPPARGSGSAVIRRGHDTVGSPHRTQISQFELFEFILFLKLDKPFPVERFEAGDDGGGLGGRARIPAGPRTYFNTLFYVL